MSQTCCGGIVRIEFPPLALLLTLSKIVRAPHFARRSSSLRQLLPKLKARRGFFTPPCSGEFEVAPPSVLRFAAARSKQRTPARTGSASAVRLVPGHELDLDLFLLVGELHTRILLVQ